MPASRASTSGGQRLERDLRPALEKGAMTEGHRSRVVVEPLAEEYWEGWAL